MATRPAWAREARKAMIDRDLRPYQLADALGVSRTYLANAFSGFGQYKTLPRLICEYLKIPYTED